MFLDYAQDMESRYIAFISMNNFAQENLLILDISAIIHEIETRFMIAREIRRKFPKIFDDSHLDWSVVELIRSYWVEVFSAYFIFLKF